GLPPRIFTGTSNAWLYALQAAKASITVWGIWLGHVYHWHIVTAAMQMTMYNRLPAGHRLRPLLEPQSQFLIDFDYILLKVVWDRLAPPTPVDGPTSLLKLLDRFASGREFFDDDPPTALRHHGLDPADFTVDPDEPWDAYPAVGLLLGIWNITYKYVETVVDNLYPNDNEVASDTGLKAWMDASRDPSQGNVRGLPEMNTRDDLIAVLTSLLYRVTAHGAASLSPSVNPVMSFVANFPPCLQSAEVPEPSAELSLSELLDLLPHTGTLGGMTTFYYTFAYTSPDAPLIPAEGVDKEPQFEPPYENCNPALVAYRSDIQEFIVRYEKTWNKALAQIRGHDAELPPYAHGQDQQWPRSIEI
ncbi:MAG: lipoxygenase family protein, partial [Solirubrobacteraceae bacterium]